MKTKVISKGYTITVVSWENDGDNYNTKSIVIESKEKAEAIVKMCNTIFKSSSNGNGGIGNMDGEDEEDAAEVILPFMKANPILFDNKDGLSDQKLIDICMEHNDNLMGGSEYYYSRVCEKCTVTYSSEDVFNDKIEF